VANEVTRADLENVLKEMKDEHVGSFWTVPYAEIPVLADRMWAKLCSPDKVSLRG
jgi:hypothetical protein